VLSVCKKSIEINKIALVIFKFISVHVRRPGARNDVKWRQLILALFRHVVMQKCIIFLH